MLSRRFWQRSSPRSSATTEGRASRCVLAAVCLAVALPGLVHAAVAVEAVLPGGAGEAAGLVAGDLLDGWRRGELAGGRFDSVFDVLQMELEEAPRGPIMLLVRRAGQQLELQLPTENLRLELAPELRPAEQDERARRAELWPSRPAAAVAGLFRVAAARRQAGDGATAAWLLLDGAATAPDPSVAEQLRAAAVGAVEAGEQWLVSLVWEEVGRQRLREQVWLAARAAFTTALALRRTCCPGSLAEARTLNFLAIEAARRDAHDEAGELFRAALALRSAAAPGSLSEAASRNNVGSAAWERGDLAEAERCYEGALAIKQRLAPRSLDEAAALNNLGMVARQRGHLEAAEAMYRRALAIKEELAADDPTVANSLSNLALVLEDRGELDAALELHQRALALDEAAAPASLNVAVDLGNLGSNAGLRRDFTTAEAYLRRQLAIYEELAPDSPHRARCLHNLGQVALAGESLDEAEKLLGQSLALRRRTAPGSLGEALDLESLGDVAARRGDGELAEARVRQALAIVVRRAPATLQEARLQCQLAAVLRAEERPDEAVAAYGRGLAAFEEQLGRVGGSHRSRSAFRAQRISWYHDLQELLVELGRADEAFHVLERARARMLLELLGERDLVFESAGEAALDAERKRLAHATDRALAELAAASADEEDGLRATLAELERARGELRSRIRAQAPGLAALRYPEPLDLHGARQTVGPGVTVLAYSLGDSSGLLYVLTAGNLEVHRLQAGALEFERRSSWLLSLLEDGSADPAVVATLCRRLYGLLLAPAEAAVAAAERLLIIPDGPLHLLPFAALTDADGRHLVERVPLSTVSSLTLFGELAAAGRGLDTLLALGDPRLPALAPTLPPLPAARREVAAVAGLFGQRATVRLGEAATEAGFRSAAPAADALHLAAHVLVDPGRPLSSGVLLAADAEGRHNGLLQAWEVLESLRLDAALVVLSGCRSAVGERLAGEGLEGLSRAFHAAGARTVLASLWQVEDASTAALMEGFYRHLRAGVPADEALRRAQLALLAGTVRLPPTSLRGRLRRLLGESADRSHPFYWAAFRLDGSCW